MNLKNSVFFKIDDTVPIIIIVATVIARLFSPYLSSILLNYIMPVLMLWRISKDQGVLKNSIVFLYIVMLIWVFLSVFTGISVQHSLASIRPTFGGLIVSLLMYSLSRKSLGNASWLLIAFVVLYFSTMLYIFRSGVVYELDEETGRIGMKGVNANDMAYFLFYTTIAFSLLGWDGKSKMNFWNLLSYVVLIIFTLYTSIITASRQVLLVVLPFALLSVVFRLKGGRHFSSGGIIGLVLFGFALILGSNIFVTNYMHGSFLEQRMQMDIGEDDRVILLEKAIEVGIDHPIFGVGPGNYQKFSGGGFSHCSYTELFATSGLLAMILFIIIVYKSAKIQHRRYIHTHNRVFLYLYISTLVWAAYNVLYVFYISPWLISFLFVMIGYSDSVYNMIQNNKKNENYLL